MTPASPLKHTARDWILFLVLLTVGAWARLANLERTGIRTVDEGSYCFFAIGVLQGAKGCIQDKPGQALLLAAGFTLLGISQYAALQTQAMMGIAALPALYWLGLGLGSKRAAVTLMAAGAFLPYLLLYHRSAASDSNAFFFAVLALGFFLRATETHLKSSSQSGRRWLAACGFSFGLAATVNLASIPTFGVTAAFLVLLGRWRGRGLADILQGPAVLAAFWAAGVAAVELPFASFIDFPKVWGQVVGHAGQILETGPQWGWAAHLWRFTGPVELGFALFGLVGLRKWWRTPCALFPLLLVTLTAFYARAELSLPRLHLPLLLAILPLMALGLDGPLDRLQHLLRHRMPAFAGRVMAAALFLVLHTADARHIASFDSGYPEACSWLARSMSPEEQGVSTHSFWTFSAFTGRLFRPGSDRLAEALNAADWERELFPRLQNFQDKGFSYLALDYLLFNRLQAAGIEHLGQWVRRYPPDRHGGVAVPNPVAGEFQTWAEDGLTPPLDREPLSHWIYIYRISDLLSGMERKRGSASVPED
ncbi:MAG: hypothetical protein HYU36_07250 [Planctomycetes bacterium]|nr:hypothetical protein [Planctomycetota bacterium]